MKAYVEPKAVVGSTDPTIPTPEMKARFEPELRSKEWIERRTDVKIACAAFVVFHLVQCARTFVSADSLTAFGHNLVTMLVALYWGDLVTGIIHIYLDHRRCDLGDGIDVVAYSFRYDHHAHPTNFFKEAGALFPAGLGEIILKLAFPISLVCHLMDHWGYLRPQGYILACTWVITGPLCQTMHALAHEAIGAKNKRFVANLLQRSGLILSPKEHAAHHRGDHDSNFCIFNGWANPLLNAAVPYLFSGMRKLPNHFDANAVPAAKK